ncbi:MAG: DUF4091 domain-containing protein [Alloprevotella sp.]|nr:DUF4091 domain-containing protein [Alloprevotella sp.]
MKKSLLLIISFVAMAMSLRAQDLVEPDDGAKADSTQWTRLEKRLYVSWASRDVHYAKTAVPLADCQSDTTVYAWRGERIGIEAVLFSPIDAGKLKLQLQSPRKASWLRQAASAHFLRYVLTDQFKSCGAHPTDLPPYLVPDVIDTQNELHVPAMQTRPVWLTIDVPRNAPPGEYVLTLSVSGHLKKHNLRLRLVVSDRTLPAPADYAFHLDFWQQPYAVSRYYGVERWSDEHFNLLRPYMELLARGGQSVVSAILFYEPWGDQSHDKFSPMVQVAKRRDGSWAYDYSIFDRWVAFMQSCGISKQINCFSMVPWDMTFRYYDETQGQDVELKTTTSAAEYRELWTSFLKSFATHLKEKGWFEKTLIAMDERGLGNMLDAYAVAQEAVPGLQMALAGNYHAELADKLADYCVAYGQHFTEQELSTRRERGWTSTFYTSCAEREPNIFTNSSPAEAAYLPLYAVVHGFDGYLHWSWLNWPDAPLTDSRYRLFPPGDTFVVYPGPRSSVRWERFMEGVQQAEKIRILRAEYQERHNEAALARLNTALKPFADSDHFDGQTLPAKIDALERVLNTPQ